MPFKDDFGCDLISDFSGRTIKDGQKIYFETVNRLSINGRCIEMSNTKTVVYSIDNGLNWDEWQIKEHLSDEECVSIIAQEFNVEESEIKIKSGWGGPRKGAGRPATGAMPTKAIRLPEHQWDYLEQAAIKLSEGRKEKISASEYLRILISKDMIESSTPQQ
jgi:hypothetical protein